MRFALQLKPLCVGSVLPVPVSGLCFSGWNSGDRFCLQHGLRCMDGCSAWLLPTLLFKDHVSEFSSLLLSLSRMVLFPEPPNTTFRRTCALEGRDVKDYCSEWEMPWGRATYEAKAALIYCAWSQKGNSSRGVFCTTAEAWADSKQLPCKQKSERSLAREEV